jgi:hypothetical protein
MKNRRSLKGLVWVAVAALGLSLTSCDLDEVLEVVDPDTVNPGTLDDPAVIDVVITGAYGDFVVAYSGDGGDSFLSTTSLITDEFFSTGTFGTRTATDRRIQQTPANGNTSDGAYVNLQQARRALMLAVDKVAAHEDYGTSSPEYGELNALWGYTYVALGEGYCSYVPISNDEGPDPSDGPPRASQELFEEALPLFEAGISNTVAKMGKARALMNLGRYSEAAAAVAGVPTTYNYFLEHSDNAFNNPFYSLQSNGRYSISHHEGGNQTGMPFRGVGSDGEDPANADPRLPWYENPAGGFDSNFRSFVSLKYPTRNSSVTLTSGIEARLIEAEAALASGGDWLGILNQLRSQVGTLMAAQIEDYASSVPDPSLAPLSDPGDAAARVDLLFQERALWLWGTGHRVGDMRRLVNQYGRSADSVYPSGAYHKGGSHGPDVVFPVSFEEANNALYDLDQCVAKLQSTSFN